MSSTAAPSVVSTTSDRLEVLFAELAELAGQRNAIDGRIVQIAAQIDRDQLWGATGARSLAALMGWRLGLSTGTAHTLTTIADRIEEFPRCVAAMAGGRLSLDQVAVIAARAGEGSDEHYAALAAVATVSQLRTAVKLEPRPTPDSVPAPEASFSKTAEDKWTKYRITLPADQAATFDAALASHRDALYAEWKHDGGGRAPTNSAAFMRLVQTGWDVEAARRPHGQH